LLAIYPVKSTIFHWVLVLFLLSGGLSTELVMAPSHIEFAAEEDFSSFDRQDESFKPSVPRKRGTRERKTKVPYTPILVTNAFPPDLLLASRHSHLSPPATLSHQQLHQIHQVFRI
jgi:hypothetical protein